MNNKSDIQRVVEFLSKRNLYDYKHPSKDINNEESFLTLLNEVRKDQEIQTLSKLRDYVNYYVELYGDDASCKDDIAWLCAVNIRDKIDEELEKLK